ncbi:Tricarboxylate/iron carrier [Thelonectria olida]|uniref:Tricarboxylate/iron carrier n=1 Tax=Thelonectria olida TaxID=1576542 RepID=A0A9P9AXD2_9HYPO|nr:Tricarboxylate/iron carrier [Thelonectria olida]
MSTSLPGTRELPPSQYDLGTYMGRVRHTMSITDPTTLLAGTSGLDKAKELVTKYKAGKIEHMTPELWSAKKIVDSTLHPDTGEPVFLPFRMSCYVFSNLIVTAGMLQPGLQTVGIVGWQVANQSLNVAFNSANANKSSPMTTASMVKSYFSAVGASVSVALGLNAIVPRLNVAPGTRAILSRLIPFAAVASASGLNTYLMRRDEIVKGIDVRPVLTAEEKEQLKAEGKSEKDVPSLGKSHTAAKIAVYETAASRVLTGSPIMVIPPMVLYHIEQKQAWFKNLMEREFVRARPTLAKSIPITINLGLIAATSFAVLPFALAVFPQQQEITAEMLEPEFHGKGGKNGKVIFNRGL